MPADFAFFDYDYEYWVPARFDAAFRGNRDQYFLAGLARLKPGIDVGQAEVQLNTVMDAIRRDYPQFTQNAVAGVQPVKDVLLDGIERRLLLLMGAAGFVLIIACANLGNLLLARASTRQREMAVRHALGAGHGRLVRQILAESLWLTVAGGLAGLALGAGLLQLLVAHLPQTLPRLGGIALGAPVVLFTAGVSVAAGLVVGLLPALHLTGGTPFSALRDGTRVVGRTGLVRTALVCSELALALMLLVGAGLLARSFAALLDVPPGFSTDRLLTFTASVPTATYRTTAERAAFFERAATELERLPGVRSVTMTTALPVAGRGYGAWFNRVDRPWPADQTPPGVPYRIVRAELLRSDGHPAAARPRVLEGGRSRGSARGGDQRVGGAALLRRRGSDWQTDLHGRARQPRGARCRDRRRRRRREAERPRRRTARSRLRATSGRAVGPELHLCDPLGHRSRDPHAAGARPHAPARSRRAAGPDADDGRHPRTGHGAHPLVADPGRRLRDGGVDPRDHRRVRRAVLHRHAAGGGIRRPHGARRHRATGAPAGARSRHAAGR